MKISIITVTRNSAGTITRAMDSVLLQTYRNVEYIVIDGASEDGTVDIVQSYGKGVTHFVSEADNGIYEAMNKGLGLATGDVVGILNSDDFYSSDTVLAKVAQQFKEGGMDCLYGNLVYVDKNNTSKVVRRWISQPYREGMFARGWHIAHPTFFVRREVYQKYGGFRTDFKIAGDYELILRFVVKHRIQTFFLDETLVCMRTGGASNRSAFQIIRANLESYRAWGVNGLSVNPFFIVMKLLSKLRQYRK